MTRIASASSIFALITLVACGGTQPPVVQSTALALDQFDRNRFNQLALLLDAPAFWIGDADGDGAVSPGEIASLDFYSSTGNWIDAEGHFNDDFEALYRSMVALDAAGQPADARLSQVYRELGAAALALIATDLSGNTPEERDFARRMVAVGRSIDALYARQVGMAVIASTQQPDDPASRAVFRRNWGPACLAPAVQNEELCSALPGSPDQPVDVYPAALQREEGFCEALSAREDSETLLSPFVVVRESEGELIAVPYTEAYSEEMTEISTALTQAASVLSGPAEEALRTYLRAAAQAFLDNDWVPADEAWSRMNAENSKWYVRVGPDEVYWDPCSNKAGFHMTFALIDSGSLEWQERLAPLQQDMESAIAALVETYEARETNFHLPDFIEIVVNAGDDRDAFGATIGQSLPNWGPVANENRGRTVAMTNLYTDPDSAGRRRAAAESMVTTETLASFATAPNAGLMSTILHEATHNLGPAGEYEFEGKTAEAAFGGEMASMLEELKAQTGALFLLSLLKERGVLDEAAVNEAYLDSILWAFGHISRGMYTAGGHRKAYSQLAAIQVGELIAAGAITWDASRTAGNGTDPGSFSIDYAAMPAAAEALMAKVVGILAVNDVEAATALAAEHVDGDTVPQQVIAERYQRFPRQSFVFAVSY